MTIDGLGYRENLENNMLYQGKERQFEAIDISNDGIPDRMFNWYDFEARYYDQQIGRWHVPDPAEQYYSPYLAMGNNPNIHVDPTGLFADTWRNRGVSGYQLSQFHQWSQYNSHYDGMGLARDYGKDACTCYGVELG